MRFLLAHLSDPHIGPIPRPRLRDLLGKRLTGYVNWRRSRHRVHDMPVLARIVADCLAQKPDHIAMTGDILNLGLPDEFPPARGWLQTLGRPADVSFVPGNHDAYVAQSMPHLAESFSPWTGDRGDADFPTLRVRGELALIGLSSGLPTAPFLASGRLGRRQSEAFDAMLADTARQNLTRVVMIHHPPHRDGASFARGLTDAARFQAIIARRGADLILHGHNHRRSVAHLRGPKNPVPVVGVPSASAVPGTHSHRAAYHLFAIERAGATLRIEARARGLVADTMTIGDLGAIEIQGRP